MKKTIIFAIIFTIIAGISVLALGSFGTSHVDTIEMTGVDAIEMTDAEKMWLETRQTIRVAYDPAWYPFEYMDKESGKTGGLSGKYFAEIESSTGADLVTIEISDWADALESVKDGRADMLLMAADTEQRREFLGFTEPHSRISVDMITVGTQTLDVKDLAELRVATVKDYAVESWLDQNRPEVRYASFENAAAALEALEAKSMDIFLENEHVASITAKKAGISGGVFNAGPSGYEYVLSIGFAKESGELGTILQKVIDAIPQDQKAQMLKDVLAENDGI